MTGKGYVMVEKKMHSMVAKPINCRPAYEEGRVLVILKVQKIQTSQTTTQDYAGISSFCAVWWIVMGWADEAVADYIWGGSCVCGIYYRPSKWLMHSFF